MKKIPKSFQAIIVTLVVGMLLPKLIDFTGIIFIDKILTKGLLSIAFNLATIIVGVGFSIGLLKGKKEGGKARIAIYLLFAVGILCFSSAIAVFFEVVGKIISSIFALGAISLITYFIIKVSTLYAKTKKEFRHSQNKSVEIEPKNVIEIKVHAVEQQPEKNIAEGIVREPIVAQQSINIETNQETSLKNLYELWREKPVGEKCLTATNHENPDLKWVKIYKPPYGNGKFYGYVLMNNARHTVNGEIYFADRKIWELVREC